MGYVISLTKCSTEKSSKESEAHPTGGGGGYYQKTGEERWTAVDETDSREEQGELLRAD